MFHQLVSEVLKTCNPGIKTRSMRPPPRNVCNHTMEESFALLNPLKTGIGEVIAIFWTINDPHGLQELKAIDLPAKSLLTNLVYQTNMVYLASQVSQGCSLC